MFLVKLLLSILVILSIISFITVKVHIVLDTKGEEIYYNIKISVLKFIKFEFNKEKLAKLKDKAKDKQEVKEKVKEKTTFDDVSAIIWASINALKHFLKHLSIRKFSWETSIGLADAAQTAITYGTISGVINSIIGFLSYHTNFKSLPEIIVEPIFGRYTFSTRFECIISFKVGKAILTGLQFIKTYARKKNKYPKFTKKVKEGETY